MTDKRRKEVEEDCAASAADAEMGGKLADPSRQACVGMVLVGRRWHVGWHLQALARLAPPLPRSL